MFRRAQFRIVFAFPGIFRTPNFFFLYLLLAMLDPHILLLLFRYLPYKGTRILDCRESVPSCETEAGNA